MPLDLSCLFQFGSSFDGAIDNTWRFQKKELIMLGVINYNPFVKFNENTTGTNSNWKIFRFRFELFFYTTQIELH